MSMRLSHATEADETLEHQVRFYTRKNQVYVSCNCRATTGTHSKAGKPYYDPIGLTRNLDESRSLYNDPANHWGPFGEEDKATW